MEEVSILRRELHQCRLEANYKKYCIILLSYFFAIHNHLKLEQDDENQKEYRKLLHIIKEPKLLDQDAIFALWDWELSLRDQEKDCGLTTKIMNDPRHSNQ